jgi:hypothetical protein
VAFFDLVSLDFVLENDDSDVVSDVLLPATGKKLFVTD